MYKILFYNKFIICLYMFRALCAHHQEVKIVLYSIWYHPTCRCPSCAQVSNVSLKRYSPGNTLNGVTSQKTVIFIAGEVLQWQEEENHRNQERSVLRFWSFKSSGRTPPYRLLHVYLRLVTQKFHFLYCFYTGLTPHPQKRNILKMQYFRDGSSLVC